MPRYFEERKAAVLKKLLPPQIRSMVSIAAKEGTSDATLYSWLKQCRQQGMPVPGSRIIGEDCPPPYVKLAAVVETAPMSEAELSAYYRKKGPYPEKVQHGKDACLNCAGMQEEMVKSTQKQLRDSRKTIKKLKAEVRRKDKVLAEPATGRANC